jgi:rhamnogalacturonyl hydrolase YesR
MARLMHCAWMAAAAAAAAPTLGAGSLSAAGRAAAPLSPAALANVTIASMVQQPYSSAFWSWSYGPAVAMSAMYEISRDMGQAWAPSVDAALAAFVAINSSVAWSVLNNVTVPWTSAIGDEVGLMPIAYLSRADFYNESAGSQDWTVATRVADEYVLPWPFRLADGTIGRTVGWPGQPVDNASFVWSDDGFMGITLAARLARHGAPNAQAYLAWAVSQQLDFAAHLQDPGTRLYFHGFNSANNETSCCFWGRANGWALMSHAEVMLALAEVDPSSPLLPAVLSVYQSHAAAMAKYQVAGDGRWYQLVNDSTTFLETSVTSMAIYSLATGVMHGWLPAAAYDSVIQAAWEGLSGTVAANGSVSGICEGTGILNTPAEYAARPTAYAESQPGLGSVFRAALAYYQYQQGGWRAVA